MPSAPCSLCAGRWFVFLLGLIAAPASARSQQPSSDLKPEGSRSAENAPARSRFCFRPNPSAGCLWFPITEVGLGFAITESGGTEVIWELGVARVLSDRGALGGTIAISTGDEGAVSVAPRARLHLTKALAFDLTPGVVVLGERWGNFPVTYPTPDRMIQTIARGQAPALVLEGALTLRDWAGAFVRTSIFHYSDVQQVTSSRTVLPGIGDTWVSGPPETVSRAGSIVEINAGIRAGSYPGLGLAVLVAAVALIFLATYEGS